jgi:hypothetical protein
MELTLELTQAAAARLIGNAHDVARAVNAAAAAFPQWSRSPKGSTG